MRGNRQNHTKEVRAGLSLTYSHSFIDLSRLIVWSRTSACFSAASVSKFSNIASVLSTSSHRNLGNATSMTYYSSHSAAIFVLYLSQFQQKRKQTAVTNIFILYLTFRMLQHTSSEVTVKTVTQNFKKLERGTGDKSIYDVTLTFTVYSGSIWPRSSQEDWKNIFKGARSRNFSQFQPWSNGHRIN